MSTDFYVTLRATDGSTTAVKIIDSINPLLDGKDSHFCTSNMHSECTNAVGFSPPPASRRIPKDSFVEHYFRFPFQHQFASADRCHSRSRICLLRPRYG